MGPRLWRRARRWCVGVVHDLAGTHVADSGGVNLAKPVPLRTVFTRFWPYARPHRLLIATTLLLTVLSAAITTATIGMFKLLVDEVLVPRDLQAFWWVAAAYIGLTVVTGAVGFGRRIAGALAGERFVFDLRNGLFSRLQLLSLAFFEQRHLGDTIARVTGDIKSIERLVVSGVFRALSYVLRIMFFTVALFVLRWELALAALAIVPFFGLLARRFSRRIKAATRQQTRHSGALSAVLEESLANIGLVQAYNRQDDESERFKEQNYARFRARLESARLRATFSPLVDLTELAGTLIVAGLGTLELIQGRISLGGLLAFAAFLSQLYGPVRRLGTLMNTVFAASAGAERVLELMDAEPMVRDAPHPVTLHRPAGSISFNHVDFTYPDTSQAALRDLCLDLAPGSVTAITGPSGAGKSSIVKLLLRFYDPSAGSVSVDDHELTAVTTSSLRDQVAVVFQETLVFDDSIANNIAWGRSEASFPQIVNAARAADLHDFIETLSEGYNTRIGQRGRRLSGGQRQRVAIARAIIRDAPILILDEPTTGLDADTSARLLTPLGRLLRGRTTLLITHDPHTATIADRIITVADGAVVNDDSAPGTHRELEPAR